MQTAPFRLLVIDDHPVVLYGLRLLLRGHARFAICAEAATVGEARAQAEALQPDFIIADLVLGGRDGIAMIEDLTTICPARIMVYSSHDELVYARHVLKAGAKGYVSKNEGLEAVEAALNIMAGGEIAVSAAVQALTMRDYVQGERAAEGLAALSARELQVLDMIGRGHDLQMLARELSLSSKTIGTYRERLKTKLGIDTAQGLQAYAIAHAGARAQIRP